MSKLQDLQQRRDIHAARCAELELALDDLSGLETIADVQKLSDELGAARRLLAALDRQVAQAEQASRAQEIAAREARRLAAAKAAAEIRGKLQAALFPLYSLTEQLEQVTAEFPEQAAAATQTRLQLIGFMRMTGIDVSVGIGTGVVPVRK